MPRIDQEVIVHHLNIIPGETIKVQKRRIFNLEWYFTINEEVKKLTTARFIRKAKFPEWVSDVVMVKRPMGNGGFASTTWMSTKRVKRIASVYQESISGWT